MHLPPSKRYVYPNCHQGLYMSFPFLFPLKSPDKHIIFGRSRMKITLSRFRLGEKNRDYCFLWIQYIVLASVVHSTLKTMKIAKKNRVWELLMHIHFLLIPCLTDLEDFAWLVAWVAGALVEEPTICTHLHRGKNSYSIKLGHGHNQFHTHPPCITVVEKSVDLVRPMVVFVDWGEQPQHLFGSCHTLPRSSWDIMMRE